MKGPSEFIPFVNGTRPREIFHTTMRSVDLKNYHMRTGVIHISACFSGAVIVLMSIALLEVVKVARDV